MSASSIDQILQVLRRNQFDKKQEINRQFEKKSQWLAEELELIRKLIHHDPRDVNGTLIPTELTSEPECASSSKAVNKKRKSPETSAELKLSPEQKRSSVDVKEIIVALGLPADLSKLKKELLLEELKKRGCNTFTMKNLKNELVEALENAILSETRNSKKEFYESQQQIAVADQANMTAITVGEDQQLAESNLKPRRQGSLLDQFREKVYNNITSDGSEVTNKANIENEFRNRHERHRESIARKSQIPVQNIHQQQQADSQEIFNDNCEEETRPKQEQACSAMEISSPVRIQQSIEVTEDDGDCIEATNEVTEEAEISCDEVEVEAKEVECIASELASTGSASELESTNDSLSSALSRSESEYSKATITPFAPPTKKPSNLMNLGGDAVSFLDKPTNKPMVPALLKAKQLKEQEEEKALRKKELKAAKVAGALPQVKSPWGKVAKGFSKVAENVNNKMGIFTKKPNTEIPSKPAQTSSTASAAPVPSAPSLQAYQAFDVRAIDGGNKGNTVAETQTAAVESTSDAEPTVENLEEKSVAEAKLAVSAPTPAPLSSVSLPPKSAIKDIISNYNNAIASSSAPAPAVSLAPVTQPSVAVASVASTNHQSSSPAQTETSSLRVAEPNILREKIPSQDIQISEPSTAPAPAPASAPAPAPASASSAAIAPVASAITHTAQISPEEDFDPANEYQIEDSPDSDSDASGTDDEDESDKKKQQIPEWARGPALREALERQYGLNGHTPMDPDLIFPEVQSCSLEEIFGRREGLTRKYNSRTSSAHWDADELTLVEKRQYRAHMGFDSAASTSSQPSGGIRPQAVKLH